MIHLANLNSFGATVQHKLIFYDLSCCHYVYRLYNHGKNVSFTKYKSLPQEQQAGGLPSQNILQLARQRKMKMCDVCESLSKLNKAESWRMI